MDSLRSRIPLVLTSLALAAGLGACGDGDGSGAAEEVDKATEKLQREAKGIQRGVDKYSDELRQDLQKGRKKKKGN